MPVPAAYAFLKRLHLLWLCAVLAACLGLFAAWTVLGPASSQRSAPAHTPVRTSEKPAGDAASASADSHASRAAPGDPGAAPLEMPPAMAETAEYLLAAFPTQGMRHITDAAAFTLLPPGSVLAAQIIRRGETPEVLTTGVSLRLKLEPDMRMVPPGGGKTLLEQDLPAPGADETAFASAPLGLLPYTGSGGFNPYPLVAVEAFALAESSPLSRGSSPIAFTKAVLPVSTEMGCRNCHTGPWKESGAGISDATAADILRVHDKRNRTRLARDAAEGKPADCRSCHESRAELPNLSAAVHGFHAAMDLKGPEGCSACHAASETGQTRFFRDIHAQWGLECSRCHGSMEQHALSLLLAEKEAGKKAAGRRMRLLAPDWAGGGDIVARKAWVNMPHCSGCHNFAEKPSPDTASAYGKWTKDAAERFPNGLDNTGKVRCSSCHGPVHAVYPAQNPLGDDRDVIQPLQYQHLAAPLGAQGNCAACHKQPMDYFVHHDRVAR